MIRPLRPSDEPAVRTLQTRLEYADPELVTAAVDGLFVGRVAAVPGSAASGPVGYAIAFPGEETTLSELVVAPGHRREGHGRRLLEAVVEAAGAERTVVTTPAGNDDVVRFYARLGFEHHERLNAHYADGTDGLRLVRRE
jgi:ribosomal-protein-alanine N-acetyltransferase